ncbi:hypothetical protein AND_001465 [Anopheles darlingi]|uniref:Uncharacterized protein n=1 Tax=Anopheles darlingi TaxID=43151 RepID=W5JUV8_ANODA|nr:hypothetical protein AND_001465 [Anopheles darlingi]
MITKQRLSDNASLGDISTNSVCDVAQATASSDGSSSDASRSKTASQEALKSEDYSNGRRLLPDDEKKVIPGPFALEDSCNAVDNALRPDLKDDEDSKESDLSFNGKINNLKADKTIASVAANDSGVVMTAPVRKAPECELIDATKGFERADTRKESIERARQERLNKSAELLAKENSSWIHYNNEKSPDLFADEDDEEEEYFGRPNDDDTEPDEVDEGVEVRQARSQKLRHSSGLGLPENEQSYDKRDRIDHVERVWLKRLQLSLSGVPPPPSLTFSNMDIDQLLTLYGERSQQVTKPDRITPANVADEPKPIDTPSQMSLGPECLSKPTHSSEQLSSAEWPDLLKCRAHGLHYNKSTVTEKLELLGLKYVERYIGAETSSSFNMTHSPSSAKKRNQRMKMLNQSPGSRLSHLARRRAIFSSANLLNTNKAASSGVASNNTGGNFSKVHILSRLNPFRLCNRQVLLDPKKSDNRRKSKIKTPKRRTPSAVKASPHRRTPGSSAKKRPTIVTVSASCSQPLHVPATRESSKRALFLSPQNGDHGSGSAAAVVSASRFDSRPVSSSKQQLDRVIFSEARMMRSKRTLLFSPQKGDENRTATSAAISFKRARSPEGNDVDGGRYQRHNDTGERTEKIRRTEGSGLTEDDLTPRSLKFARSKSFCVGAQASNDGNSQTLPECNGKSLFRANSAITSEDGNRPVMVLTENHKKKLLWAVSQALQSKQITVKHESFKQHASNLVRVVKKLFLEFNDNSINSTSEKLLRLANKHVFEVIQGKSVDDIYFREKTRILNARNMPKLQGYIGPEEYEMRQLRRAGSMASSLDVPSLDCSSTLGASQNFLSQTSVFSQTSSVFDLSQQSDTGSVRGGMRPAASTGNLSSTMEVPPMGSTTVLRENINSELRQRSSQKQVSFSGKDSKCVIPYAATDKVPPNNKLLVGGGGGVALTSSILKAKRQILFE